MFEAVQVSVNPKVITTPKVAAMAKDGIQLLALARVTVRANINRLVGGAGEETILARVGEGIVSTIGSAESHKKVLENPDMISKTVLAKGLDAGTAFEILSIDIADVDVGKNIGAELQTDQAEADKRIAQAKAEERRALAVAMEQEYKAEAQKQRAFVIAAEAQIPLAMAEAFRSGNLGVMDYQRYRNIQADTAMRQAIAGQSDSTPTPGTLTVDFGGLLVLGVVWLLFNLLGRARGGSGSRPRTGPRRRSAGRLPRRTIRSRRDATQREGSRLEQFLRELERNLEQSRREGSAADAGQAPRASAADDEDVEERESLEAAGAGGEPGDRGRARRRGSSTIRTRGPKSWCAGGSRRRKRASGALTRTDHKAFDEQIRQEPADHTAVRRYTTRAAPGRDRVAGDPGAAGVGD